MSSVLFAAQSVTEAPRHARLPVFLINKHLGGISGALRGVIRKKWKEKHSLPQVPSNEDQEEVLREENVLPKRTYRYIFKKELQGKDKTG